MKLRVKTTYTFILTETEARDLHRTLGKTKAEPADNGAEKVFDALDKALPEEEKKS